MKIELLEYFPTSTRMGSLKVKLVGTGLTIQGMSCFKMDDGSWRVMMPGNMGKHKHTGKKVRYTYIMIDDREERKELLTTANAEAQDFIAKEIVRIKESGKEIPEHKFRPVKKKKPNVDHKKTSVLSQVSSIKGKTFITPQPLQNRKPTPWKK